MYVRECFIYLYLFSVKYVVRNHSHTYLHTRIHRRWYRDVVIVVVGFAAVVRDR